MTRARHAGLSLVEVLLATVVVLITITAFALLSRQSALAVSTAYLAEYSADVLTATTRQIQQGNPEYTRSMTLSPAQILILAKAGSARHTQAPALTGTVAALGHDPPRYRVTLRGPGLEISAVAVAPGGTP